MYDHSNKIGNKGDLIKHFALTAAIRQMSTGQESFSYLDVHSGRSRYDLPDAGDWKHGIGSFSEHCRNKNALTEDQQYFCKVHSIADIPMKRQYFGSSQIVLNVLKDSGGKQIHAILCDTNTEVCKDLENDYAEVSSVEICCMDGYQKAHDVNTVDLVFIDPPDIQDHYQPFMELIRHCITQGKPFISWNPLHGNVPQKTMSRNCLSVAELTKEQRIAAITVRWTKGWSGQMCGCQMLFSIPQGSNVVDACEALIKLMGWNKIHAVDAQH